MNTNGYQFIHPDPSTPGALKMHPVAMLRVKIDEMNKKRAKYKIASGGDLRSTGEALNTSANALGMASMRYPKAKLNRKV